MSEIEERVIIEEEHCDLSRFGLNLAHIGALKKAVYETPDIDLEKIKAVKQEIDSGFYTMNSTLIAAGMLSGS